ncbi:family 10 glycosylhydrolase [Paenibacillus sp. LMG 31458]|uniref:Family 10 glycosylhydrolase n=1 Tax=Paenibacillus phytorum TaxID=2654977 RepID=A0ABX1Y284_9BACL|nr:family 10 glycosylhydrolase [Paenibacillus phytorum]NOU74123.1 family 10 glycosylhydrolase [Paenibacillus phytorum]
MAEQEINLCLEQAEKLIANAQRTIKENWDACVNAPFDLAREHVGRAVHLLEEARELQLTDSGACMRVAKQTSAEALDGYFLALPSRVAEARGVWYRPTEQSREEVCRTLDRVQAAGFNELYLETWFWGYTIYPSRVATARRVEEQHPAFRGWDPLEAFVKEAGERGIAVHAWLDGFMVGVDPTGGPVLRTLPEWSAFSRRQTGSEKPLPQQETGYFWLDITNPEVRQYLLDIMKEMIMTYGVAGINLDFMRFPHSADWKESYCFSEYAREAFRREHGNDPLGTDAERQQELWKTWTDWLEQIEDDFVADLYKEIKSINPQVIVSAAPEPGAESEKIGNWSQHVDVVIPQAYYSSPFAVRESVQLHKNELQPGNLVYSGIYPMYIRLGALETVDQVLAARDLDNGTVIFAFGQASNEAIRVLRMGPWRTKAISTGMFPLRAIQGLLEAAVVDVEQVYIPRGVVSEEAAIEIVNRVEFVLGLLQKDDLVTLETEVLAFKQWIKEKLEAGIVHPAVELQLTKTLKEIQELLLYSRIKQVK